MKIDPRTEARYEEEKSDLLMKVTNWELAGHLTKKLYKRYPRFTFSRSHESFSTEVEISVHPSPDQMTYNVMQGYAQATYEYLVLLTAGE